LSFFSLLCLRSSLSFLVFLALELLLLRSSSFLYFLGVRSGSWRCRWCSLGRFLRAISSLSLLRAFLAVAAFSFSLPEPFSPLGDEITDLGTGMEAGSDSATAGLGGWYSFSRTCQAMLVVADTVRNWWMMFLGRK